MIELMIVVAIIGIIAAIAIPSYQDFVGKSQLAAGIAEITPGKIDIEMQISEGKITTTVTDVPQLGLQATTERCSISTSIAADGVANITCILKGGGLVNEKKVVWMRDPGNGASDPAQWTCKTDVAVKLRAQPCLDTLSWQ